MQTDTQQFNNYFEKEMKHWFNEEITLHKSCLYSLLIGGKRIRPLLSLAFSRSLNGNTDLAYIIGAAVEMIHTYSLIHDDLPSMDNDELRRGHPTNHVVYGEAMAILAGDTLLTEAPVFLLQKLSKNNVSPSMQIQMISVLMNASGKNGMALGQSLDLENTFLNNTDRNQNDLLKTIENIHHNKTGQLLSCACQLGALTNQSLDNRVLSQVKELGDLLGLSFQVMDDLLDQTSNTFDLGKTSGKDLAQGKLTYPSILGIDETRKLGITLLSKSRELLPCSGDNSLLISIIDLLSDRISK